MRTVMPTSAMLRLLRRIYVGAELAVNPGESHVQAW
jgi:hypothetical protein